jgi:hypothetical protein
MASNLVLPLLALSAATVSLGCVTKVDYDPPPELDLSIEDPLLMARAVQGLWPSNILAQGSIYGQIATPDGFTHISGDVNLLISRGNSRLTASHPLHGRFIDIGENQDECWFWSNGDERAMWWGNPNSDAWNRIDDIPLHPTRLRDVINPTSTSSGLNASIDENLLVWYHDGTLIPKKEVRLDPSTKYPARLNLYGSRGNAVVVAEYSDWVEVSTGSAMPLTIEAWFLDSNSKIEISLRSTNVDWVAPNQAFVRPDDRFVTVKNEVK